VRREVLCKRGEECVQTRHGPLCGSVLCCHGAKRYVCPVHANVDVRSRLSPAICRYAVRCLFLCLYAVMMLRDVFRAFQRYFSLPCRCCLQRMPCHAMPLFRPPSRRHSPSFDARPAIFFIIFTAYFRHDAAMQMRRGDVTSPSYASVEPPRDARHALFLFTGRRFHCQRCRLAAAPPRARCRRRARTKTPAALRGHTPLIFSCFI